MQRILAFLLPLVLPIASKWAELQEQKALEWGHPLDRNEIENAERMGVRYPERIRLMIVDEITGPNSFLLRKISELLNFFGPGVHGISYRYGIWIRKDRYPDPSLVAHECVHTAQYERFGGFRPFLHSYLRECLLIGYPKGPLEQEAIRRSGEIHEPVRGSLE